MKKILLIAISLIIMCYTINSAMAQNLTDSGAILDVAAEGAGYDRSFSSPEPFIGVVIKAFLSFLGVLFLVLMIYGGFLWMTARGNESQVTKSKDLIIAAVIGLIIILLSYAISSFVISSTTKGTLNINTNQPN
jgi:Type IV secretion system pilin